MPATKSIRVEVAWVAQNGRVERRSVEVAETAHLDDALAALDSAERDTLRQAIAEGRLRTAIYGRLRDGNALLQPNDRIELLGELALDPKIARRLRVQRRRALSSENKWTRSR